jgi:hypothetical protein
MRIGNNKIESRVYTTHKNASLKHNAIKMHVFMLITTAKKRGGMINFN